jgi:D-alanyl-D-alanine-carboxypeptidase/D-alanyl-D-alanine-endopeptidase
MMLRNVIVFSFTVILAAACAGVQSGPASPVAPDAEIQRILRERVDNRQSVGIVVGVIEPAGRRVVAYGKPAKDDPRPLNGDTVFEIGSATKVFTSLLLSNLVQRGEVSLTDPVAK